MDESKELERRLSDMLTEGEMEESGDADKRERQLIPPKYEVRIQTERDPIVEETLKYRDMAREVDDRYDRYLERSAGNKTEMDTNGSDSGDTNKSKS
ncbi:MULTISPECIES: hypothetical protein [unclassified Paenibacillus]|uniref:hypothetical protein n=1 Tax=unclassified Paenibacillus TaxID=185978 RepID=UPI0009A7E980|nr:MULTISPECIES: hypothetical protein [unclassified Paenibacillus]SLK07649.1 hypothetical protein SAMN06272722_10547 [Paenibacillus sp. RU5A]SOC70803.1 hypothetical protein SAMN05880581_10546 [Paenibacillus sp. RU26A]SOC73174.1 hypothetical protein SAMN05880586_10547 [Paenibacillus sp. RU5M]